MEARAGEVSALHLFWHPVAFVVVRPRMAGRRNPINEAKKSSRFQGFVEMLQHGIVLPPFVEGIHRQHGVQAVWRKVRVVWRAEDRGDLLESFFPNLAVNFIQPRLQDIDRIDMAAGTYAVGEME